MTLRNFVREFVQTDSICIIKDNHHISCLAYEEFLDEYVHHLAECEVVKTELDMSSTYGTTKVYVA